MRHKSEDRVRAVHMHNDGMSWFKNKDHIWQHNGIKVTRKTISDWTKKYSDFLKSATPKRRYVTAHLFVEKRTLKKCVEFLNQIKLTCYNQILEIYKKEKHKKVKKRKLIIYHTERYNGKTKDRIKVMRGGFNMSERAESFMNLRYIIHNFVDPHQQLKGRTPAEAAEINTSLGRNKLLNLIKYVGRSHITKT